MIIRENRNKRELKIEVSDLVMVKSKYLTSDFDINRKKKLVYNQYSPYKVINKISDIVMKIELPEHLPVHNSFHISHLKKYKELTDYENDKNTNNTTNDKSSNTKTSETVDYLIKENEINKIQDKRIKIKGRGKTIEYLI